VTLQADALVAQLVPVARRVTLQSYWGADPCDTCRESASWTLISPAVTVHVCDRCASAITRMVWKLRAAGPAVPLGRP